MRTEGYMGGSPPSATCKQLAGIQLVQIPYGVGHILGGAAVVAAVGGRGVAVAVAVAVVGSCA